MADSKYQRILQLFPPTFRPQDGDEVINNLPVSETTGLTIGELWQANVQNPVLNAVLRGFAQADDEIATALDATKASLFVRTAENQQLDVIASSLGVSRPGSLGISDTAFQNLVPPLSLRAKQVRQAFYNAMDAFYGPEFSRANLITTSNAPFAVFNLVNPVNSIQDTLTFTVDDGTPQSILVRTDDLASSGAMTALELNTIINDNISGATSEILVDPITKTETVRVRTNTPGLRGSLLYSSNRRFVFSTDVAINAKDDNTRTIMVTAADGEYLAGDIITIDDSISFVILNVQFAAGVASLLLDDSTTSIDLAKTPPSFISERVRNTTIDLFPTDKAELIKQDQRTVVYELTPNNVIIELPAVLPSLERSLRGSLHVHNGPLINNLIFRGETTTETLPDSLFDNATQSFSFPTGSMDAGNIRVNAVSGDILELTGEFAQIQIGDTLTIFDQTLQRNIGTSRVVSIGSGSANDEFRVTAVPAFANADDTISIISRPNFYNVTSDESWITYDQSSRLLTFAPPAGQDLDVYEYTVTNSQNSEESFRAFVRVDNRLAPAADQQVWEGAFVFNPSGDQTAFTVSGESAVITGDAITGADTLAAGRVFPRVNVESDSNTLPTTSGLAVIGYGSSTQEPSLIRYRGRAADDIIELDPSFVFTNNQPSGTYINIVSTATPFTPDRTGGDYPIYLTSSTEARVVVQGILQSLAAAGVVVTFVALAPDYRYLIDNPYLTDDDAPIS